MAETEIFFSVKKSRDGGYEARALGHPIFTQAKTMRELRVNVTEAVACHFSGSRVCAPIRLVKVRAEGRILGSAKGEFIVPDDFNDALPKDIEDLFWE